MGKEYELQARRYGEYTWLPMQRPDGTIVEPFDSKQTAFLVGAKLYQDQKGLYKDVRIREREVGEWKETDYVDIAL